jgi:hypothetical protein
MFNDKLDYIIEHLNKGGEDPFLVLGYSMPDFIQTEINKASVVNVINQTDMFMPLIDTSNVTNMRGFFDGCNYIYIPSIDTSNVTNMLMMC